MYCIEGRSRLDYNLVPNSGLTEVFINQTTPRALVAVGERGAGERGPRARGAAWAACKGGPRSEAPARPHLPARAIFNTTLPPPLAPPGIPETPSDPTMVGEKTAGGDYRLRVTFACPTVFNARFFTYALTRTDLGKSDLLLSADKDAANASPRIVAPLSEELGETLGAGEQELAADWATSKCSFTIPASAIPDADQRAGQYSIKLVRALLRTLRMLCLLRLQGPGLHGWEMAVLA